MTVARNRCESASDQDQDTANLLNVKTLASALDRALCSRDLSTIQRYLKSTAEAIHKIRPEIDGESIERAMEEHNVAYNAGDVLYVEATLAKIVKLVVLRENFVSIRIHLSV